ncbi:MAG: hypothetical protein ACSLE6_09780 [Mycobacterium sp.]
MTVWLWFAPRWAQAAAYTAYFTVLFSGAIALPWLLDLFGSTDFVASTWPWLIAGTAVLALVLGALASVVNATTTAALADAVRDLPPDQRRSAQRALVRGPMPTDPNVRSAAQRIAAIQNEARRKRGKLVYIAGALGIAGQALQLPTLIREFGSGVVVAAAAVVALLVVGLIADLYLARHLRFSKWYLGLVVVTMSPCSPQR